MAGRLAAWWHGSWTSAGNMARSGAQHMQRFAAQAPERAWHAGRKLAAKVITVQESARLPEHLMRQSARSVITRPDIRMSDAAWRDGYRETAMRRVPGLAVRPAGPELEREAGS